MARLTVNIALGSQAATIDISTRTDHARERSFSLMDTSELTNNLWNISCKL